MSNYHLRWPNDYFEPDAVINLKVQNAQYDETRALPSPPQAASKMDSMSMFFLPNLSIAPEITAPKPSPHMYIVVMRAT